MSFAERRYFGLRVALWYAVLFVAGAGAIAGLTYHVAASSFEQRDRQILQAKLGEYAEVYRRGGAAALAETVRAEQATAPERLFVRIVDRGAETIMVSMPSGWDQSTLEMASLRLPDGALVQVGKSAEATQDLLARFRLALSLLTLAIVGIALAGGWFATQAAVEPVRRLTAAVKHIVRTGRTDGRVEPGTHDDAIKELTTLFNAMLDRIESLVAGIRGALDNVSHDLRTPLTRLRASAEMTLAGPEDVAKYREALGDAVEEADRVLVMLNTLMDISEAESGAMPLHREPVRVVDVVDRAIDLYRDVADAKDIDLSVSTVTDVTVLADRTRLEQVVANLLDNAIKYTQKGGRVSVRIDADATNAYLSVEDNGAGIGADELPRIWERLYRGDRSRTERGLGLGLSLVKAVVEAHGGSVNVDSEAGRGSTFRLTLSRM